jgi:hypothetical protein
MSHPYYTSDPDGEANVGGNPGSTLVTPHREHIVSDAEKTFAFLAHLSSELHDLKIALAKDTLDVDEWSLPGTTTPVPQTIYNTQKQYYKPIVVDYILAVFPIATTAATLQLGPRIIPISNLASGVFIADVKLQLEWDDIRQLTIAPGGLAYLEIMGHCDAREIDRK